MFSNINIVKNKITKTTPTYKKLGGREYFYTLTILNYFLVH